MEMLLRRYALDEGRLRKLEMAAKQSAAQQPDSRKEDLTIEVLPLSILHALHEAGKQAKALKGEAVTSGEVFSLMPGDMARHVIETYDVMDALPVGVQKELVSATDLDHSLSWTSWDGNYRTGPNGELIGPPLWEAGWFAGMPLDRFGLSDSTRKLIEETVRRVAWRLSNSL
jgi:hypothetical protein